MLVDCSSLSSCWPCCLPKSLLNRRNSYFSMVSSVWWFGGMRDGVRSLFPHLIVISSKAWCWPCCLLRISLQSILWRDCFSVVASQWSLQSHSLIEMHNGKCTMATIRWLLLDNMDARWLLLNDDLMGCTMANAQWLLLDDMDARWLLLDVLDGMCTDGIMANIR